MSCTKLPSDAFEFYVGLGTNRNYQTVAEHFETSKRAVTRRAASENWQRRLAEIDEKTRQRRAEMLVESAAEMDTRHLKMLRAVQARAVEALQRMPLSTSMEAVRAVESAVKLERLIRGEPSERKSIAVEEICRLEAERWLCPDGTDGT